MCAVYFSFLVNSRLNLDNIYASRTYTNFVHCFTSTNKFM